MTYFRNNRRTAVRRLSIVLLLLSVSACESQALQDILASSTSGNGDNTIAAGLREALTVGSKQVVSSLGSSGGFSLSPSYRIPLPESLETARSMANTVGLGSYFDTLVERYNALPLVSDIDADLTGHVVQLANQAIFTELGKQEAAIRQDPARQTTALLRQVFGSGG